MPRKPKEEEIDIDEELEDMDQPAGGLDPIIKALLTKLPGSGSDWPAANRKAWLDLLSAAIMGEMIYKTPGGVAVPPGMPRPPVS